MVQTLGFPGQNLALRGYALAVALILQEVFNHYA